MVKLLEKLPNEVKQLAQLGILRDIDLYVVDALNRRFAKSSAGHVSQLAACLANRTLADAHICLKLEDLSAEWVADLARGDDFSTDNLPKGVAGMLNEIKEKDLEADSKGLIGKPNSDVPFVLNRGRLYLRRYWDYEKSVADKLKEKAKTAGREDIAVDQEKLSRITEEWEMDEKQGEALEKALNSPFVVISGGPGTGKTFTAARILYLLVSCKTDSERTPIIRMAAPTGKAADRLNSSIQGAVEGLNEPIAFEEACTIERLLGYIPNSPYFKHNSENRLPADVVLIDEASMVDLPKMAKLLDALKPDCRLILLGDMHQLASVAPGSVLGDICASDALQGSVVELTKSRRFEEGGPIAKLSKSINTAKTEDDAEKVWKCLIEMKGKEENCVQLANTPESLTDNEGFADTEFAAAIIRGYADFTKAEKPETAFDALDKFRVLCAMRHGPHGASTANRLIENILSGKAVKKDDWAEDLCNWNRLKASGEFYDHRVILVTRNDYSMKLFNGDVGVILPDCEREEQDVMVAYFRKGGKNEDGQDGGFRKIACRLLPDHETAFAITVHKSQGSEFENVLVMLPPKDSPVVTKELIYTAITRTVKSVKIWCSEDSFKKAVITPTKRSTGLREQL